MKMEPTTTEIQELRTKFTQKVSEENKDFHHKDIARINNDDKWLKRFLLHHDSDMKEALSMLLETCEWRKNYKVNEITESSLNMSYLNDGSVFVHNRDKDGKSLFIFIYRKHVKGQRDFEELKKIVIYWMERVERMDKGEPVTVFFDMQDTGLSNTDMDYIKYIISLFKLYYPYSLNYILIFEMPWVLNAAFKIIKTWLPAKAVQKIKFVDKKSLKEYVDNSQALKSWGGQDSYEFTFVPENATDSGKNEENKKKVHFADGSQLTEPLQNSFGDSKLEESPSSTSLTLNPGDAICFGQDGLELSGTLSITNSSDTTLIYKVKTTSPEKFRVRPSCGLLSPTASASINIVLLTGYTGANILRDKFLVLSYPLENHDTHSNVDLNDLWKLHSDPKKLEEHRLRCKVPSIQPCAHNGSPGSLTSLSAAASTSEFEQKITQLLISMNHLTECNAKMQSELILLRRLVFIVIFLVIFCGVTLLLFLPVPEQGFCPATMAEPALKLEK